MAGSNDFTGQNIQDTYQRVLQISSSDQITDGTGSLIPFLNISASYALTASIEITKEISSSNADSASLVMLSAQPNITSLGTLNELNVNGNITASGDISSSGNINAAQFQSHDKIIGLYHGSSDTVRLASITAKTRIDGTDIKLDGPVTASGNISASGGVYANGIFNDGRIYPNAPLSTDHFLRSTSATNPIIQAVGGFNADGNVTASGNISSSGDLIATGLTIDGFEVFDDSYIMALGGVAFLRNSNNMMFVNHTGGYTNINLSAAPITASGDISSSGNGYFGNEFYIDNVRTIYRTATDNNIGSSDRIFVATGTNIELNSPVTASGDISASGYVYGDRGIFASRLQTPAWRFTEIDIQSDNGPVNFNGVGGTTVAINTVGGHITASGNISSSGNLIGDNIQLNGTVGLISNANQLQISADTGGELAEIYFKTAQAAIGSANFTGNSLNVGTAGLNVENHITASGNISSSAQGIFDTINVKSSITGSYPKLTDSAGDTIFKISGVVQSSTGKLEMGDVDNAGTGEVLILDNNSEAPVFYNASAGAVQWGINTSPADLVGSKADFLITSEQNYAISASGNISIEGNITASGDISSSTTVYAEHLYSADDAEIVDSLIVGGAITASGMITASAGISASNIAFVTIHGIGINSSTIITTNGATLGNSSTFDAHTLTGRTTFTGNVTASNNINAAGDISASGAIITSTLNGGPTGDQSGSLTLSGSLLLRANIAEPAVSASVLFAKSTPTDNADDTDLRFGNSGLTPAFAWVTLDDDGTDTSSETLFGVGSAVTSTVHNMDVVHDTSTNGTRIHSMIDGVYKVTGNYIFEGTNALTTLDIKVDGTTVHTQIPRVHSSVDPTERTHIYVGIVNSGSYVTATADGNSLTYDVGSVLMVERLA